MEKKNWDQGKTFQREEGFANLDHVPVHRMHALDEKSDVKSSMCIKKKTSMKPRAAPFFVLGQK